MEPIAAAPGITRITTPLPFRPRSVHAYLIDGGDGRVVLVDGGADTPEAWAVLDRAVGAMPGGWGAIALQVVTHMHLDHIGLAARVRSASRARLAMGRMDAERSAHAAAEPAEEAAYRARVLREAGADPGLLEWSGTRAPAAAPVRCDLPLPEEEAPLPGCAEWRAVWTPGHTAGHISLFRKRYRVLIGGDAVLPRISPTLGVNRQRDDPVGDYLESLERLASLAPSLILPGHGAPITEPARRIRELRDETVRESERVSGLLGREPRTVAEVVAGRYAGRDLPNPVWVQAIRETRAHLDRLVAAGEARAAADRDAVRFWHP